MDSVEEKENQIEEKAKEESIKANENDLNVIKSNCDSTINLSEEEENDVSSEQRRKLRKQLKRTELRRLKKNLRLRCDIEEDDDEEDDSDEKESDDKEIDDEDEENLTTENESQNEWEEESIEIEIDSDLEDKKYKNNEKKNKIKTNYDDEFEHSRNSQVDKYLNGNKQFISKQEQLMLMMMNQTNPMQQIMQQINEKTNQLTNFSIDQLLNKKDKSNDENGQKSTESSTDSGNLNNLGNNFASNMMLNNSLAMGLNHNSPFFNQYFNGLLEHHLPRSMNNTFPQSNNSQTNQDTKNALKLDQFASNLFLNKCSPLNNTNQTKDASSRNSTSFLNNRELLANSVGNLFNFRLNNQVNGQLNESNSSYLNGNVPNSPTTNQTTSQLANQNLIINQNTFNYNHLIHSNSLNSNYSLDELAEIDAVVAASGQNGNLLFTCSKCDKIFSTPHGLEV